MSAEEYEAVQLIVDNLVLQGSEANLLESNAVSKAYVDAHVLEEKNNRVTQDDLLSGRIADEVSARESEISRVQQDHSIADGQLSGRIDTVSLNLENEVTNRGQALAQAVGDISETTSSLRSDLNDEVTNRSQSLAQAVSDISETTNSLRSDLNGEVTNREQSLAQAVGDISETTSSLQNIKRDKTDGVFDVDVTVHDYLNFGERWRVKASSNGTKSMLNFQHKKLDGVWRTALPFIASN